MIYGKELRRNMTKLLLATVGRRHRRRHKSWLIFHFGCYILRGIMSNYHRVELYLAPILILLLVFCGCCFGILYILVDKLIHNPQIICVAVPSTIHWFFDGLPGANKSNRYSLVDLIWDFSFLQYTLSASDFTRTFANPMLEQPLKITLWMILLQ